MAVKFKDGYACIPIGEYEYLVDQLKKAFEDSSMDRASFATILVEHGQELPKRETEVTEFIKRRTHLWRASWIREPLHRALRILSRDE